ncbi:TatD-related deoxyribonuclease [Gemmatimonadetes bacterium T265]|nr:TatD-related deoxyribonuclease [Gemmatimonadetes bacterium T265]
MPPFLDSHAHLADAAFADDRDAVVERAREAGATGIVAIGESIAVAECAREVSAAHAGFVWFTAGVHPHDAAGFDRARDEPRLRALLDAGAVAVGECGLDYHYDHSPREAQHRALGAQLALAAAFGRPLVVHSREADADTYALLRDAERAGVVGVLHCFTGPAGLAAAAVAAGWYVSFSGMVTFKRWDNAAALAAVPPDRLLAESDAPYLAPAPDRGKRNEPAWVARTVARLAELRGVDAHDLGAQTAANARRLFGLDARLPAPA